MLHAVRIVGFADTLALARRRLGLDPGQPREKLLDAEAHGRVQHAAFAGLSGWSLTERGRAENERLVAAELDRAGAAEEVRKVYRDFLSAQRATAAGVHSLAASPHFRRPAGRQRPHRSRMGRRRPRRTRHHRAAAASAHRARLWRVPTRFGGYDLRFAAARWLAASGDGGGVDRTDIGSCHRSGSDSTRISSPRSAPVAKRKSHRWGNEATVPGTDVSGSTSAALRALMRHAVPKPQLLERGGAGQRWRVVARPAHAR